MAVEKEGGKRRSKRRKGDKGDKGGKRRKRAKNGQKDLVNYAQMKALSKEERVPIYEIFCERMASPKEIAVELNQKLSNVSYHVRVLVNCGLIELDHKVPRRGAVEHFYKAVTPTLVPPHAWRNLPPAVLESISLGILQEFFEDASGSLAAGLFDSPAGELSWTPLILDTSGIEELGELSRDFVESVLELQVRANERLRGKGKSVELTSATVFLASFLSARSPKEGKKASATKRR